MSAKELSDLNHHFRSWRAAYQNGTEENGYHDKKKSVVDFNAFPEDIGAVGKAVRAYKETMKTALKYEVINGVRIAKSGKTLDAEELAEIIQAIIRK